MCLQKKALKTMTNPIIGCQETADNCAKYSVIAKGFFSSYTQKAEPELLEGAKNLIVEVTYFPLGYLNDYEAILGREML